MGDHLPGDEKLARQVALTRSQYVIEDNVLYKLEGDGTLRVIPPTPLRSRIFQEAQIRCPPQRREGVQLVNFVGTSGGMKCGPISPDGAELAWCVLHTALDGRFDLLSPRSLSPDPSIVLELTLSNFPDQEMGTSM